MSEYVFIDRQQPLDLAFSVLEKAPYLAIDTESSGYYTYFPELCLIQISTDTHHFLIDPLARVELGRLGELFASPGILKIFHAAASDMGEFRREYGWTFSNVFDTHLAARYLQHEGCSLMALVQHYAGVQLEKKEQKSNWRKRPLTRSQLDYAHLDTVFLQGIMVKMIERMRSRDLLDEYTAEMDWLCRHFDEHEAEKDEGPAWLRVSGAARLSPVERGRFKQVFELREERARKENIAAFRLVSNRSLFQIVQELPESTEELVEYGLHPVFLQRDGFRLLEVLREAEPIHQLPYDERRMDSPEVEDVFRRLREWRVKVVNRRKIDPALVLSNRILKEIARKRPGSANDLQTLSLMSDWKINAYGPELVKIAAEHRVS